MVHVFIPTNSAPCIMDSGGESSTPLEQASKIRIIDTYTMMQRQNVRKCFIFPAPENETLT
jgi:hypothetical protein